jgi:hypothetical protein
VSGETAAIGIGFLVAGPVGAVIGGAAMPALVAASMWRTRRREDDDNANDGADGTGADNSSGDRTGSGSGGARGNGNRGHSEGGGGAKTPKNGGGLGGGDGTKKKPKTKDPVADKLSKAGKALADKLKNRDKNGPLSKDSKKGPLSKDDKKGPLHKAAKDAAKDKAARDKAARDAAKKTGKDKPGVDPKSIKTPKPDKGTGADKAKDRKWPKDRGPQPASDKPWRNRGPKDKTEKAKRDKRRGDKGNDTTATTAPDGLDPKGPKGPRGGTDPLDDRIDLVKSRRERARRRRAINVGKKAAADAARDGTQGDPRKVKLERIRQENHKVDLELHREDQLLALAAATEHRRSKPVTYPVATTQPSGARTPGVAVARQIDVRGSSAYKILVAMAEQLANGFGNDDDADMADHIVELTGIPNMCRNLSTAVIEAGRALAKTAPLHPSVIKHLNNAATAARAAAAMSDTILVVFVQAHRQDIFRVMNPRIGEERWNLRNGPGTLDAAKLRAAILSANTRRPALPAGGSSNGSASHGGGKLVPASDASTRRLITLMKGFDRGHMTVVLSEVAGSAGGVEVVADSVTRLYRRMAKTWPTERVVDDTVRATASKVKTVAAELRKAIVAAQRAHERDLRLNAKPRKGPSAEKKWDVVKGR